MAVLDDLSGFEFEDLMEDVFRELGYENVRQADRTADEGRDIMMEEVVDGTRRAIVVECKHTATVGRPVLQKLHSAVATFDFDGPKRGMVATTGRFTNPAREYAQALRRNNDPYPIELLDGTDLRSLADEIGLDLYNGRIEILCDETLRPHDSTNPLSAPLRETFQDIKNIDRNDLPEPHTAVTFRPVVAVTADTNAVFETSVGVIHRITDRNRIVVHAEPGRLSVADSDVASLVFQNRHATVRLEDDSFTSTFDEVETRRFGKTQTEYKNWTLEQLQDYHRTTVRYTGDNNVTYSKTCEPNRSDISIQSIEPVFLPQVRQEVTLKKYDYPYEYFAAGPSRVTSDDGIHRCVQCGTSGPGEKYTYCENCGSINCERHTKTERLEGQPICTGCAVTESFMFDTKHFYDEANREAFREQYAEMAVHEKAMENPRLVAGLAVMLFGGLFALLVVSGAI